MQTRLTRVMASHRCFRRRLSELSRVSCQGQQLAQNACHWNDKCVDGQRLGCCIGGARVKVEPVRVLGRCGGFTSDIVDAIVWASGGTVAGVPDNANPADVINMSLGSQQACTNSYQTAIDAAVASGTTVVAAGVTAMLMLLVPPSKL